MTAKTFPYLSRNAGKAEEIEWLESVANSIEGGENGAYLSSLFTKDLVNWASEQVRNDVFPNIWAWYQHACEEITTARCDLGNETARREAAEENANRLRTELESVCEKLHTHVEASRQKEYDLYGQIGDLSSKVSQLEDERDEIVRSRDDEIIRLKAAIYDLEHAK